MDSIHKTIDFDEYSVHYYVTGVKNKESIVFLHPAFSDHRAFEKQIDFFSWEYKVITIDLLGHGLSGAAHSRDKIDACAGHIKMVMEKEKISDVHIVGVSMGSLVAQHFALQYPMNVKSLIAMGGYSIHRKNKKIAKAQMLSNLNLVFFAIFSMNCFRKKTSRLTTYTKEGQDLFYNSASLYTRKSFNVMRGFQHIIKDRANYNPKCKILILTGEHDIPLAHTLGEVWHKDSPGSKYEVISNAGHCANMDQPKKFNTLVWNFISSISKDNTNNENGFEENK